MKKRLLIFICICIPFLNISCDQKTQKKDNIAYEYYDSGKVKKMSQVINDSIPHGIMKTYSPDGYLQSVYNFIEGKREGPAVTYYNNGTLKSKMVYKDNQREGLMKMYYKTGELYREIPYNLGKVNGIRKTYYRDGSIMAEAPYKNSFPGLGLKEYKENGSLDEDNVKILVRSVDRLAMENLYILKLSLSASRPGTQFFIGDLLDGKYLYQNLWPIEPDNGVATYRITLPKGTFEMTSLIISASYQTPKSNYALITRNYNLAIDNK
jgi:MORN repeat variant